MVNEINMAKWIVALRSGKYEQGQKRLLREGKYCCLGVACDISAVGQWVSDGLVSRVYAAAGDGSAVTLPRAVCDWLGTDAADPSLDGDAKTCASANDQENYDFSQIADALEATYLPGKKAEEILAGAA